MTAKKNISRYIQCIRLTSQDFILTYISLALPFEDHFTSENRKGSEGPWGIAWINRPHLEDEFNVAFSRITEGWIPKTGSDLICLMLENLERKWIDGCSATSAEIDHLVSLEDCLESQICS